MKARVIVAAGLMSMMVATSLTGCGSSSQEQQEVQTVVQEEVTQQESAAQEATQQENIVQETAEQSTTTQEVTEEEQNEKADVSITAEDFAIQINDVIVRIGDDINTLTESLGEPDDYSAAKSCTGNGEDKVYQYGDAAIYTYPTGAEDVVYLMELEGEIPTAAGICVGSAKTEVISAYGEGYIEDETSIVYELEDGLTLSFQLDGETVTFVEIYGE